MRRKIVTSFGELDRAAPADVGDHVHLRDLPAISADVIEDEPFAQREVAQGDLLGAERVEDGVEQHGAGNHQIRTPGIESRDREARFEVPRDHLLPEAADLLGRHPQVAQLRRGRAARRGRRDGPEAENRAGRADDAVEPDRRDLFDMRADLVDDLLDEFSLVAARDRIASDKLLGQPDDTHLEASRELHFGAGAKRDFDTASADVDDDRACAGHVHAVDRRLMNQAGFLGPGDHPWTDAGLSRNLGQERAAVLGLARRAGRGRDDLIDAVGVGETLELGERLQGSVHRFGRERSSTESPRAKTYHHLFAIDHFK